MQEKFAKHLLDLAYNDYHRSFTSTETPVKKFEGNDIWDGEGQIDKATAFNLIKEAVRKVEKDWVQYFNKDELMFCGFDSDKIVSFCKITDQGIIDGIHIGDPGCVGTIPEYRKQGIGLELVRLATKLLKDDGFDISWIHGTPVPNWYTKLGYKPVLRWNKNGFIK